MRILSNFDTQFCKITYQQKVQDAGKNNVFLILRSRYYLFFKVIFPFLILLGILVIMVFFLEYTRAYPIILWLLCFVWFLVFWFRIFRKFLKYKYDFTIVTPRGVVTYQQRGILSNKIKEIPSKRIKAIQVSRTSLLGNIFGFGEIDIIADIADMADTESISGDNEAPWVMGMTYVDHPFEAKNRISKLCFE